MPDFPSFSAAARSESPESADETIGRNEQTEFSAGSRAEFEQHLGDQGQQQGHTYGTGYQDPHAGGSTTQLRSSSNTASSSMLGKLAPPCNQLTNEMAGKSKAAIESGNIADVIHRAMQLKNRGEEFGNQMYYESAMTNAILSVAAAGPAKAIAMGPTLAIGHGVIGAHLAVKTRSDNASHEAFSDIEAKLGSEFAKKVSGLPYDKEGLAEARRMLHQVDNRFHAFSSDPRFSTKSLAGKEAKKGGDVDKINALEWSRATGLPPPDTSARQRRT